ATPRCSMFFAPPLACGPAPTARSPWRIASEKSENPPPMTPPTTAPLPAPDRISPSGALAAPDTAPAADPCAAALMNLDPTPTPFDTRSAFSADDAGDAIAPPTLAASAVPG